MWLRDDEIIRQNIDAYIQGNMSKEAVGNSCCAEYVLRVFGRLLAGNKIEAPRMVVSQGPECRRYCTVSRDSGVHETGAKPRAP